MAETSSAAGGTKQKVLLGVGLALAIAAAFLIYKNFAGGNTEKASTITPAQQKASDDLRERMNDAAVKQAAKEASPDPEAEKVIDSRAARKPE